MSESFWTRDIRDIGRDLARRVKGSVAAVRDQWRPQTIGELDNQIESLDGYGASALAGIYVTPERAMNFSAFFCGVLQICQTIASLPCILYKREGEDKKRRYTEHPAYRVMKESPNAVMDAFGFKQQAAFHALVWGNAYGRIHRDGGERLTGLTPLNPAKTSPRIREGRLEYVHKPGAGLRDEVLAVDQVLHVPGFGFNGIEGYSLIRLARESLGLGLGMEQFAAMFFGRGTHIGGVLEHPKTLTDEAHQHLKADFAEKYSGLGNAHKAIVLEEGMKWHETIMPLDDAQFLESRVFSIQEIARWLNMPPHKLKELSKATYDNITSEQISWLQDTIRPWLVRFESAYNAQLLSKGDREEGAYFEHLVEAMLRTDIKTRFDAYGVALDKGWMNRDEVRAKENLNPMEGKGGKIHTVQLAMVDINELSQKPDSDDQVLDEEDSFPGGFNAVDRSIARRIPDLRYLEIRSQRSIMHKRRHAISTKPRFLRAVQDILNFEIPGVLDLAASHFGERKNTDFRADLAGFYERHRAEMAELFRRGMLPLAEGIRRIAAAECGGYGGGDPEFQQFLDEFVRITVSQYIRSSIGQLVKLADEAEEDPLAEIEARTERWKQKRADQIARRQIVDGENASAQFVYFAAGFRVRWVTVGTSCPYCNAMNGRVISQGERFLTLGSEFNPVGAQSAMKITHHISHPALHAGCDCTTVATTF